VPPDGLVCLFCIVCAAVPFLQYADDDCCRTSLFYLLQFFDEVGFPCSFRQGRVGRRRQIERFGIQFAVLRLFLRGHKEVVYPVPAIECRTLLQQEVEQRQVGDKPVQVVGI
jgi:hypothetical protein